MLGIEKKIIHSGKGPCPAYPDGSKITFHYQTRRCKDEVTLIDDSKEHGKPMELILGKKFKLEVWEVCVKTMMVNEVATFKVEPDHLHAYPVVAKSLRDIANKKGHEERKHVCGMMSLQDQGGLGYKDLDELTMKPESLEFTFEILKVEEPGEYKKESWVMNEDEKLEAIPKLKEEGNNLYRQKDYTKAAERYAEAIGMLEQLMLREKPHDELWDNLRKQKEPLLLNYAQCKLSLKDYYPVIEHTTTVLESDPDNVKALFRRAKAHGAVWDYDESMRDFQRVLELDATLKGTVNKEIRLLQDIKKQKDEEEKARMQNVFKT